MEVFLLGRENDLSKNGSGYYDPTAYHAMKNVMREERISFEESDRFHQLLETIFYITENANFEIEGRIVLKDKKTGKVWR